MESQQPSPAEHYVSTRAKLLFLGAYFFLNLFLTLSNKSVLGKVRTGLYEKDQTLRNPVLTIHRQNSHGS